MAVCFVTGAAGHIGNVLIHKLLARGETIKALCLPGEDANHIELPGVEIIRGDITDRELIYSLIEKDMMVYHLASIIDIDSKVNEKIYNVNVKGTINIVDACIDKGAEKLLYTSTVHIIDPVKGVRLSEPENFEDRGLVGSYAKTKAMATKYVTDACDRGLKASIVYPSGVIGPFDYKVSEIGQVILDYMNKKLLAYVKGGYNFVDVRDVAEGIISAMEKGKNKEGYLLSGVSVTLKEMLEALNQRLERKKLPPKIALWFLNSVAKISDLYYRIRKKKPVFSAYSLYTLNSNSDFDNSKAKQELNFHVRSYIDSLTDAVDWFLLNKPESVSVEIEKGSSEIKID